MPENDYHKKLRNTWAINREADKRVFEDKVRKNYKRVYDFVEKEITKGMLPYPAIEKVLNSAGLEKLCPELKDDKVKKEVNIPDMESFMSYTEDFLKEGAFTLEEKSAFACSLSECNCIWKNQVG